MNIYEYNSSTINEYSQEGFGLVNDPFLEVEDFGNLSELNLVLENFYYINCSETQFPFGGIRLRCVRAKYSIYTKIHRLYFDLNKKSIIFRGIIINWIGFNIIFELSNDSRRKVIPDVSGGGVI
jgi:hypothetical protein